MHDFVQIRISEVPRRRALREDSAMAGPPLHRDVFTVVDDLRLHHVDHGGVDQGVDEAPIVLLHGVAGHATAWSAVAPSLTTAGRVLAFDLRGCGDSQWSASGDYGTTRHARDVIGVLDALGHERASLVGCSWGALVALAAADMAPERVDRLVLVDIEPSFELGETDVMPRPRSFACHADVVAHERKANPHASDALLDIVAAGATRPGPGGTLVPKHDPYFFERWPFRSDDWWAAIERVDTPALVVHAGASFIRRDVTERMARMLTNGRHVEIPDSTHVIPIDAPEPLIDALVEFLR